MDILCMTAFENEFFKMRNFEWNENENAYKIWNDFFL